jgi:hypothetical protein
VAEKHLNPNELSENEDWVGNNAAFPHLGGLVANGVFEGSTLLALT